MPRTETKSNTQYGTGGQRIRSRSRKKNGILEKSHQCKSLGCEKAFTRIEHLRRHQLNHEPSHTWACSLCAASFVRIDLWKRHVKVVHGEIAPHGQSSLSQAYQGAVGVTKTIWHVVEYPLGASTAAPEPRPISTFETKPSTALLQYNTENGDLSQRCSASTNQIKVSSISNAAHTSITKSSVHQFPKRAIAQGFSQIADTVSSDNEAVSFDKTYQSHEHLQWEQGFDIRYASLTTDSDIGWLYEDPLPQNLYDYSFDFTIGNAITQEHNLEQESWSPHEKDHSPEDDKTPFNFIPVNEPNPKIWKAEAAALSCRFRMCRSALTEKRRLELLTMFDQMPEFDLSDPVFSFNSMKHGIHLYGSHMSHDYPIFHHSILSPDPENAQNIDEFYGEAAPIELTWTIITLGWTSRLSDTEHEYQMACKIQRVLRKFVINNPTFILSPPLWIIQTLFLVMVFARYKSPREDYGFATVYHGVLLDAVRRLEIQANAFDSAKLDNLVDAKKEWFKWIRHETIRRIIFQSFVFDVQHRILHGGVINMTPLELNLAVPASDPVWFAEDCERWIAALKNPQSTDSSPEPPRFLNMLKRFWSSSTSQQLPLLGPRGSRIIMYGIMSIACEMRLRNDNAFAGKTRNGTSSLGLQVKKSFEAWMAWLTLGKDFIVNGIAVPDLKGNCRCMFRLAHTLYEITSIDLQTVAGKDIIEGKRIRASDYNRSKRKVRIWAKKECALVGLSYAATLIKERLSPTFILHTHCHHCYWCLYLAGLICWNFSFAHSGSIINQDLVSEFLSGSHESARRQCDEYLGLVAGLSTMGQESGETTVVEGVVKETSGVLLVLIRLLQEESRSGMTEEGVEVLKRLVGIDESGRVAPERTE